MQVDLTKLKIIITPLVGIGGKLVKVEGNVELPITLGEKDKRKIKRQSFIMVGIDAPYNAMFSRLLFNELSVVLSSRYVLMKFETNNGIAFIRSD